jgi:hypothetical protein
MATAAADSPQAVTPPPPLIFGGVGNGWPHSSFFQLSNNSPQHRSQQQQPLSHHQLLLGQMRPAVPPFGSAFSPFQVTGFSSYHSMGKQVDMSISTYLRERKVASLQ